MELLVVAVNAVLVGADTFVEIGLWAEGKQDWLRDYLRLEHGIPSHDTFGRMFRLIDPEQFESAFRSWVKSALPALGAEIVVIDSKTSRGFSGVDATALHLVSAFAAGAGLVLGQRATAEKSNEITAIPELLSTLALAGCTVTIDAMGRQTAIAEAIEQRGADYVLAVKDNQPRLAESIEDFWRSFRASPAAHTPHRFPETVDNDHDRLETRRCYVFNQLECLDTFNQWRGLRCFAVLESERTVGASTTREKRLYLIRFGPVKRKGGIKARRLIVATSDAYRAELLGLG